MLYTYGSSGKFLIFMVSVSGTKVRVVSMSIGSTCFCKRVRVLAGTTSLSILRPVQS